MTVYSLDISEFSTNEYILIGIHTTLNGYKLAYLLNKHLETRFCRSSYDLDFNDEENKSSYEVYEYENIKLDCNWFLISNVFTEIKKSSKTSLFIESDTKRYLIQEKKKVDYFLKLEGDFAYDKIVKTIEIINKIPQVVTSYTIETNTLKSKEFLIF